MKNQIRCPYCNMNFEPTAAFKHEMEEQVKLEVTKVLQEETSKKLKEKEEELASWKKQANDAQAMEITLRKEKRELDEKMRNIEIENQRKLDREREEIRLKAFKEAAEFHDLKDAEKDKKLADALKMNEELRRKLEQGSMQTQGEVLELAMENMLKLEFPEDQITEVKKGERGADVSQTVFDKLGHNCGLILWETKNAQWTDTWLPKLREDKRAAGAVLAVLVAVNPPKDVETFMYRDGIWITTVKAAKGLAFALRFDLIHVNSERLSNVGKNEKMEMLYNYLKSVEFAHRIEGIVEAFNNLQKDVEDERKWFTKKWARQEKELQKIMEGTYGMYGDLQAVTGRQLQEIKVLEEGGSIND